MKRFLAGDLPPLGRAAGVYQYAEKGRCSFWGRAPAAPVADVCGAALGLESDINSY